MAAYTDNKGYAGPLTIPLKMGYHCVARGVVSRLLGRPGHDPTYGQTRTDTVSGTALTYVVSLFSLCVKILWPDSPESENPATHGRRVR